VGLPGELLGREWVTADKAGFALPPPPAEHQRSPDALPRLAGGGWGGAHVHTPTNRGPAAVVRSKQTGTGFKGGVSATSGVVTRVRAKAASSTEAGCGRERERDTFSPPGPSQRAAKLRPDLLRVAISYLLPAHPGTTGRRLRFPPLLSPPGGHTDGRTLRRGFRPSGERMRAPGDAVAGPPPARPCPAGALAVRLAMCSR